MSERQTAILSSIIEIYAKTAEPVGSAALAQAFETSSATIRAEMAALEVQGMIMQPHISAGRVPTDKGYRMYVNAMEGGQADNRISQAIAKRVKSAGEVDRSIKQAAESLSEVTNNLGFASLSSQLFLTGLANLFSQPEFYGRAEAFEVARLLDNLEEWAGEAASQENRVTVLIGRENPIGKSSGCSIIIAKFASPYSDSSYIGVLGSTRQDYPRVVGLVEYAGTLLEEVLA